MIYIKNCKLEYYNKEFNISNQTWVTNDVINVNKDNSNTKDFINVNK